MQGFYFVGSVTRQLRPDIAKDNDLFNPLASDLKETIR
jgi:hypothetical protein